MGTRLVWIAVMLSSFVSCFAQSKLNTTPCRSEDVRPSAALTVDYSRGQFGYVDRQGNWRIQPHFDMAREFSQGLAAVRVGQRWGYINSSARYAIPLRFFDAGPFSEGLAPVRPFSAVVAFGFINKSGQVVIRADYSAVSGFCDGLAAVSADGGWGYINYKGSMVIEPKFTHAFNFFQGFADVVIKDEQSKGFRKARIDKKGRFIWVSPYTVQLID